MTATAAPAVAAKLKPKAVECKRLMGVEAALLEYKDQKAQVRTTIRNTLDTLEGRSTNGA